MTYHFHLHLHTLKYITHEVHIHVYINEASNVYSSIHAYLQGTYTYILHIYTCRVPCTSIDTSILFKCCIDAVPGTHFELSFFAFQTFAIRHCVFIVQTTRARWFHHTLHLFVHLLFS